MFYVFITVADLTGRKLKWLQNGIYMTRQVACREGESDLRSYKNQDFGWSIAK